MIFFNLGHLTCFTIASLEFGYVCQTVTKHENRFIAKYGAIIELQ